MAHCAVLECHRAMSEAVLLGLWRVFGDVPKIIAEGQKAALKFQLVCCRVGFGFGLVARRCVAPEVIVALGRRYRTGLR